MNNKKAFSLLEVLMIMGIISVVTVIGFSISKRGIERAYNQYWYTGYSAISDATMDAVVKGAMDASDPSGSFATYGNHIAGLMNLPASAYTISSSKIDINAPNGISYSIEPKTGFYQITMSVPKHKQKSAAEYQTIFIYNFDKAMIYPANISNPSSTQLNLHNRADLLPFYIKSDDTTNGLIRDFYGFHDAYCLIDSSITTLDDIAKISCTNAPTKSGILIYINPKKIY